LERMSLGISYQQEAMEDNGLVTTIKERIKEGMRLLGED
jgi:hypothetical protein